MKPEYYIGIDMIDEEHKQLFKYADEAYELLHDEFTPDKYDRIDIILENLRNYTVKHFSDEEQYMESINYKKIFTQKVQHQEFIHKLDEFMEHHNDEVEDQDEQIMGMQYSLWTERVADVKRLDFMVFPRLIALAEAAWTPAGRKDYSRFMRRLPFFLHWLDTKDIYYFDPFAPERRPEPTAPEKEDVLQNG